MSAFTGKIALVSGAASGIGRALSAELAALGTHVVMADIDREGLEAGLALIADGGGSAEAQTLDVTDAEAFAEVVEGIYSRHGGLDFLFNNAGIGITGEVRDMSLDSWNRILDVNLRGVVHGIQAAYPRMVQQGSGHILNTACVAGLVPFPMTAAYCATKHAVVGLSAALRAEAADLGVKVGVVCPGTVDTDMFDAIEYIKVDKQAILSGISGALTPPRKCARAILRGVRRNRAIIPVTTHARLIWWLYRCMPRTFLAVSGTFFRRLRGRLRLA